MNITKEVYESRENIRNDIKKLQEENKDLKASRDELLHWLEAISVHVKDVEARNAVNLICAKAEGIKEKAEAMKKKTDKEA